MRTLVVVPTHNEAENVGAVLDEIEKHLPEADVLVVDDASTDGTRDVVRERAGFGDRVQLLERGAKLGLASAYLEGFHVALDRGYDAIAEIDADRSHDPSVLPTMLDIAKHEIDVVIGSRYVPGGSVTGWSHRRTWLSRWGNRYAAIVLGLAINDATAGYRVYRTDALRRLDLDAISSDGYVFQIEMTYRAVAAGMSVVEVPIVFRDRVAGHSKMSSHIVREAFTRVTWWGLSDLFTLRRRHRAYGE
jgi:glycosyltransferase involved in cell wall biosynthesis